MSIKPRFYSVYASLAKHVGCTAPSYAVCFGFCRNASRPEKTLFNFKKKFGGENIKKMQRVFSGRAHAGVKRPRGGRASLIFLEFGSNLVVELHQSKRLPHGSLLLWRLPIDEVQPVLKKNARQAPSPIVVRPGCTR